MFSKNNKDCDKILNNLYEKKKQIENNLLKLKNKIKQISLEKERETTSFEKIRNEIFPYLDANNSIPEK
jgi:peptidoglycan hydrolase CwlO-like protein